MMPAMPQIEEFPADDLLFLAYAQHMAQTAQCDSAKCLFELFAQQETRRIEVRRHSASCILERNRWSTNAACLGKRERLRAVDAPTIKEREDEGNAAEIGCNTEVKR